MNEVHDALREAFVARTFQGPSAALRERVLTIPDRHVGARRSWPMTRRLGTSRLPRILLAAALVSGSLAGLWATIGQQPSLAAAFALGSIAFTRQGDLFVADADGSDVRQITRVDHASDEQIVEFAFAPDRRTLAYIDVAGQSGGFHRRMGIVGADGTTLASLDDCCRRLSWGPDGHRLAIFSLGAQLSIIGLDGTHVMELSYDGVQDHSGAFDIAWSPDGRWIAIAACDGVTVGATACKLDHDWQLVAADGSGTRWLDHGRESGPMNGGRLEWSADSRIVLSGLWDPVDQGPSAGVQVVSPDDGLVEDVRVPLWAGDAAWWAPDSTRLLVEGRPDDNSPKGALAVSDLTGAPTVLATDPVEVLDFADWSADGHQVLFIGGVGGGTSLRSMDPDGGPPTLLIADLDASSFDVASGPVDRQAVVPTTPARPRAPGLEHAIDGPR